MPDRFSWWQRGVIYQVYPRSFADSNGDGIGDLGGVLARLDYLQWLGIDAIWFSPIFPSPMKDFGYDVADYVGIHPDFGTLDDMDAVIDAAHARGIKVILDLVANHTSDQHPWFLEARSSRDNPKRDWYLWRDPAPDGGPPNNWLAYFGGPAWTLDDASGQYYMHNFLPEQPELNWRNPAVAEAIFDSLRFWFDRGVDGFRMDVIDRIIKDAQFRDNPVNPHWREGQHQAGNPVARLLRVYSEAQPEIHEYMRAFRRVFNEYENRVAIGEVEYSLPPHKLAEFYGQDIGDGARGDELHLPFNFRLIMLPWDPAAIKAHVDEYDGALPHHAWPNYVLGNHDVGRIASRVGPAQARIAALLLLTLRGTPTLYYGDELGMVNVDIPPDKLQDPQGINIPGTSRDPARTPMQWDASANAGFCPANVEPWLPLAPDYAQVNVAAQRDDPASMLSLVRGLLAYRRQTPALFGGRYYPVDGAPDGCFIFLRQFNEQRCLVALNFTGEEKHLHLGRLGRGRLVISTRIGAAGGDVDLGALSLRPDEGVVIELE